MYLQWMCLPCVFWGTKAKWSPGLGLWSTLVSSIFTNVGDASNNGDAVMLSSTWECGGSCMLQQRSLIRNSDRYKDWRQTKLSSQTVDDVCQCVQSSVPLLQWSEAWLMAYKSWLMAYKSFVCHQPCFASRFTRTLNAYGRIHKLEKLSGVCAR